MCLLTLCAAVGAQCTIDGPNNIALLPERTKLMGASGYKHLAPPEHRALTSASRHLALVDVRGICLRSRHLGGVRGIWVAFVAFSHCRRGILFPGIQSSRCSRIHPLVALPVIQPLADPIHSVLPHYCGPANSDGSSPQS